QQLLNGRRGKTTDSMKKKSPKYPPTVAGLIAHIYDTCGKQSAKGIIRLASKAHLIRLPGGRHVEFV
ncbi:MAG TPA: hypothetical protein VFV23_07555, partial [Verrucomicrobiae bacterium]|nr:hypothetical protein [Verrucomicrobiae bacterium]